MTKCKLHQLTGLSRSYLTELEKNMNNPTILTVCKVAMALACTLDELVDYGDVSDG